LEENNVNDKKPQFICVSSKALGGEFFLKHLVR